MADRPLPTGLSAAAICLLPLVLAVRPLERARLENRNDGGRQRVVPYGQRLIQ